VKPRARASGPILHKIQLPFFITTSGAQRYVSTSAKQLSLSPEEPTPLTSHHLAQLKSLNLDKPFAYNFRPIQPFIALLFAPPQL